MSDTALLIIDVQTGFFDETPPIYEGDAMLQRMQSLAEAARKVNAPVLYMRHNEGPEAEWPIHPAIAPRDNEPVIEKLTCDSFHDTPLQQMLDSRGIKRLVITGFQTEYCIQTSARRANELGYAVTVVQDGHSTFDSAEQTAADIIKTYNDQLSVFAHIIPADSIVLGSDEVEG